MEEYDILIKALKASVEKNGEVPLTNKHLLNLLKLVRKGIARIDETDYYPSDIDY